MRIGHFAPDIWAPGGIATYIRRLGEAQSRQGHDVFYLSQTSASETKKETIVVDDDGALFDRAEQLGLDLLHLHKAVHELPNDHVPVIRTMHGNQGSCPSGSRYLKRQGEPCERKYGIGTCLWGHLVDHCGSRRPHRIVEDFKSIEREIRLAHEVTTLTVSKFLKEQMVENGCPAEQLHVVHSPAPAPAREFSPPPAEEIPRFLFMGRLEPKKGVDWLLRAAARVPAPVRIDIAGTGSSNYTNRLHDLTNDLGIDALVTFHGWLEDAALSSVMKSARAVVVPSVWQEPAGLVTLEAAAVGRPVIASEVGGIGEYATNEFALRTPPRDVEGLATHLTHLARSRGTAIEMGQNALQIASHRHSMDRFLNHLQSHYKEAIRQPVV